jgi:Ca2+-dependent lipid-binding protein
VLSTLNPVWNEEWWIANCPLGARFDIGIWDYDFMKRDDTIGNLTFNFSEEVNHSSLSLSLSSLYFFYLICNSWERQQKNWM